jgi:NADH:ubiquinone oxidoreductase subunit 6 (subunit J)
MVMEMVLLSALAGVAVLFALGVLLSKDNFYSSLFMSAALIFVASVYAIFNLQPVFVLIVFIFVGAIGIVTVALAATYRSDPERQFSWVWAVPVVITALVIGFSIYSYNMLNSQSVSSSTIDFELINFISKSEYLVLILSLVSLVVLLLLSVLKMGVGGTEN